MVDGRGAFSISRLGAGVRRGLFVAGLAAALLVGGLPAGANGPESGADPTVTLTVNPSDGLNDGQSVMVSGAGFPANVPGLLRECGGSPVAPACDTVVSGIFLTDANGAFPPSPMTVNRVINTFASTSFNCSTQQCAIVADAGGKSSRHHITFAGAGTSVPPSTAATTVPPQTTVPGSTTMPSTTVPGSTVPPTTVAPTTTVPITSLLCALLQPISNLLGGILNGLLAALGCLPPA